MYLVPEIISYGKTIYYFFYFPIVICLDDDPTLGFIFTDGVHLYPAFDKQIIDQLSVGWKQCPEIFIQVKQINIDHITIHRNKYIIKYFNSKI